MNKDRLELNYESVKSNKVRCLEEERIKSEVKLNVDAAIRSLEEEKKTLIRSLEKTKALIESL